MDQKTIQILFALLRSAIRGTKLTDSERKNYSADMLQDLLKMSAKHDVIHLLALGLKQNELISKENSEIEKYILKAVFRYERLRYEYNNLCDALEKAQIPFIPLKGSVIRKYYPEAWMRTSCDIDILVRECDLRKAVSYLVEHLEHTEHEQNSHDVSLFSPSGVHLELHYDLVEKGWANSANSILQNVWKYVSPKTEHQYWNEMSDEMFYFYHVAHMAKHLQQGGCGIRTFIDLWILDNLTEIDKSKRNDLLRSGGLLQFSCVASKLSAVWLENITPDSVCEKMQNYILSGGVYGTNENRITVQQQE